MIIRYFKAFIRNLIKNEVLVKNFDTLETQENVY